MCIPRHVARLDSPPAPLLDQVEAVPLLGMPFQAVLIFLKYTFNIYLGNNFASYFETQPLYLAGKKLEAVGNPRLLNHQQIVFRHRKTSIEKQYFF